MAHEWTEVNIVPDSSQDVATSVLLLDVLDPLVHDTLRGRLDAWFYFWETAPIGRLHLRLRVRWLHLHQVDDDRSELAVLLDDAQSAGKFVRSYEGNHGVEGETYEGEAERYGPEVWELTFRNWTSGSELALAILKAQAEGNLTKPRQFHWSRGLHLYSNQLGLSEVHLSSLLLARACLPALGADPDAANIFGAINGYFKDV